MGQHFGSLVKDNSALTQNGQTEAVGQDKALAIANKVLPLVAAANQASVQNGPVSVAPSPDSPAPAPAGFVPSGDGPAAPVMTGGPQLMFTSKPVNAPMITKPSFSDTIAEKNGEPGNFLSPGLTTKGKIFAGLLTAARGASDAIKGGALNARPGQSGFGTGFAAAEDAPRVRQLEANQLAQQQGQITAQGQEAAIRQNQIANAPLLFNLEQQLKNSEIGKNIASAGYLNSGEVRREQHPIKFMPGIGAMDTVTHEIVRAVDPKKKSVTSQAALEYAAAQGDTDAQAALKEQRGAAVNLKGAPSGSGAGKVDKSHVEGAAAEFLNRAGGDPVKAQNLWNTYVAANSGNPAIANNADAVRRNLKGRPKAAKVAPAFKQPQPVTP